MAQGEHFSAPHVVPFQSFESLVLSSWGNEIGESTRIRGTQEIRARLAVGKKRGALARFLHPQSKIP